MTRIFLAAIAVCLALSGAPVSAQSSGAARLMDALAVREVVEVMREEGIAYGEDLAAEMIPGGPNDHWREVVERVYDTARMEATVREEFERVMADTPTEGLVGYFEGADGARFIALEISARRAMMDDDIEAGARDLARMLDEENDPRILLMKRFVEANDLVEENVESALNATYMFYLGLAHGGAIELGEEELLAEVWGQELTNREETREWVYGFLLMAYGPMTDDAVEDYISLSTSPEGQAMNRALFAGFDRMYSEISYALGLAAAQEMKVQDL